MKNTTSRSDFSIKFLAQSSQRSVFFHTAGIALLPRKIIKKNYNNNSLGKVSLICIISLFHITIIHDLLLNIVQVKKLKTGASNKDETHIIKYNILFVVMKHIPIEQFCLQQTL